MMAKVRGMIDTRDNDNGREEICKTVRKVSPLCPICRCGSGLDATVLISQENDALVVLLEFVCSHCKRDVEVKISGDMPPEAMEVSMLERMISNQMAIKYPDKDV